MATKFTKKGLTKLVQDDYGRRIGALEKEMAEARDYFANPNAHQAAYRKKYATWLRRRAKLIDGGMSPLDSRYQSNLPEPKERRERDLERLEREIDALKGQRERALGYVNALAYDADGHVELGTPDLRRLSIGLTS